MIRHAFAALGTRVELVLDAPAGRESSAALAQAEAEVHRLESILSRFRPESELSQLNRDGAIAAGPELAEVVRAALHARAATGGRFDPTVLDAVEGAGYDRSFAELPAAGPRPLQARSCRGHVTVDAAGTVRLAPGARLDLGGIAKGWIAERAADILAAAGPCLVDAGGDIATRGAAFPVGVDTPDGTVTLLVEGAGLATSGTDRRRWLAQGGAEAHHLIDPATGAPSRSDLLRVTVVAGDATAAEPWAKALFLVGAAAAQAEAELRGIPVVLVTRGGHTVLAGGVTA